MAESISLADLLRTISDAGVVGILVAILAGGVRRMWVWGWQFEAIVEDRDRWRDLALRGTSLAERAQETAKVAAEAKSP